MAFRHDFVDLGHHGTGNGVDGGDIEGTLDDNASCDQGVILKFFGDDECGASLGVVLGVVSLLININKSLHRLARETAVRARVVL